MLFLLFLLYLSQSVALPPSKFSNDITIPGTSSSSTLSGSTCIDQRSIWDIIWSCIATAAACSWISVHPNMPGIDEKISSIRLRRIRYTFWAIIVPEAVIFWAMRQWYGARTVEKEFHHRLDWSITHGHFLQMGGFVLCKGKKKIGILSFQYLKKLVNEDKIELPSVTKEEIEDRSKGTSFSKAVVTIQIAWFVVQSIARHAQGLVITKLELATLALGVLNGVMYICWLGKPLDVRFHVPVYLRLEASKSETENAIGDGLISFLRQGIVDSQGITEPLEPEAFKSTNRSIHEIFIHWLKAAVFGTFEDLNTMIITDIRFPADSESAPCPFGNRIPAFYALLIDVKTDSKISAAVAIMGIIFGGIHCTAWFFAFPSFTEHIIWRVCSATIAGIAGIDLLTVIFQTIVCHSHSGFSFKNVACVLNTSTHILTICAPVYILARLGLLIVAFGTLKGLQREALAAVKWVAFLPHI